MDIHARIISNDNELTPEFRGLYGARFYSSCDPVDEGNRVIKILTANTTYNVNSTTNIEGYALSSAPCACVFEMRYYFEPIWYYTPKYFNIEFCNRANSRLVSLGFYVTEGENNTANRLSLRLEAFGAEDIIFNTYKWYNIKFEYYNGDSSTKDSRLKIFVNDGERTEVRDVPIPRCFELPTRALIIHSAMKIRGIQYLDDVSFSLVDARYSQSDTPLNIEKRRVYDFEDGIPSERDFYVDMHLKKFDDFLTIDPAVWSTSQSLMHSHDCYEIMLVQTGRAVFITEDGERPCTEGSIIIVPPGISHGISSEHKYNIISIMGNPEQLSIIKEVTFIIDNIYGEGKKLAELALYNRFGDEQYFGSLVESYVRFILLNVQDPKSDTTAIIYAMMDKIKKNYSDCELSVVQLLRDSGYAKDYARTKFCEIAKMTPKKYLTTVRMKKAKELLSLYGDNVSISRIAEMCGIVDPAVFSKNFKSYYGISPKQFIRGLKSKNVILSTK